VRNLTSAKVSRPKHPVRAALASRRWAAPRFAVSERSWLGAMAGRYAERAAHGTRDGVAGASSMAVAAMCPLAIDEWRSQDVFQSVMHSWGS
jgi:hypothetical protein